MKITALLRCLKSILLLINKLHKVIFSLILRMAEARSDAGGTGVSDLIAGPSCLLSMKDIIECLIYTLIFLLLLEVLIQ